MTNYDLFPTNKGGVTAYSFGKLEEKMNLKLSDTMTIKVVKKCDKNGEVLMLRYAYYEDNVNYENNIRYEVKIMPNTK